MYASWTRMSRFTCPELDHSLALVLFPAAMVSEAIRHACPGSGLRPHGKCNASFRPSLFAKSEGRKLALHFPCGRKPDPGQACRMASDTMAAGKRTSAKEWSNSGQVNLLMRVQLAYIFSAERVRIPRDDILWRIQANARHRGRARLLLHSTRPKQTSA